jgi:hypothetical protein
MGTRKPGPSATDSLADLPFDDGFRVHYYLNNDLSKFYRDLNFRTIIFFSSAQSIVFFRIIIFLSMILLKYQKLF